MPSAHHRKTRIRPRRASVYPYSCLAGVSARPARRLRCAPHPGPVSREGEAGEEANSPAEWLNTAISGERHTMMRRWLAKVGPLLALAVLLGGCRQQGAQT